MSLAACMIVRQSEVAPYYCDETVSFPWGERRVCMPSWNEYGVSHDGTLNGRFKAMDEARERGLTGKHTFTLTAKPITWRDWPHDRVVEE